MNTSTFRNSPDKSIHDEKRRIYREIAAFRKAHGIGSFRHISAATGGKVATMTISHMYTGTKISDDIWRQVGAGLDRLRATESPAQTVILK